MTDYIPLTVCCSFSVQTISIGYNTVWSALCECNEHNTRQSVL